MLENKSAGKLCSQKAVANPNGVRFVLVSLKELSGANNMTVSLSINTHVYCV